MTTFFYKSGGRISRYLIDYGTYHIAQLGIDTLDDLAYTISLIIQDLKDNNQNLSNYPKNLPIGRPNELIPAKHLTVNWGDFELLEITE